MEGLEQADLLVVGGSGFIGSHVVKEGIRRNLRVDSLGLGDPSPYRRVVGARYVKADISNPKALKKLGKFNYKFVVNLGGYIDHSLYRNEGRRVIRSHFDGLLNLLDCLDRSQLQRFVQVGSSDEYGGSVSPQSEDTRERPISPYSTAKVAATHLLQMLHRTENFPVVVLRLFLVYGPGQNLNRFLPRVIMGCINNESVPTSAGDQLRDFCYVDDVVKAIFAVFYSEAAVGEILNVGSGNPISIKNVIAKVQASVGQGKPEYGRIAYRAGENMALYPDCKKIKNLIGWIPTIEIDTGLQRTIDWMQNAR
jgi:nucleoside-diphosphate-sugar epimerase